MAKKSTAKFVCRECGTWHGKWVGKCEGCDAWNTLDEDVPPPLSLTNRLPTRLELTSLSDATLPLPTRMLSGIDAFDRVCGGGLVPGSVILVGGDPGIGKSTLLLQVAARLVQSAPCLYASGEEGVDQVRLRAQRMQVHHADILLASTSCVEDIIQALRDRPAIRCVIVDSIQTMATLKLESAPGSVSQVRASSFELIAYAKAHHVVVIFVGHVTKDGALAGPKVLEHMVDTVLYFEGEKHYPYRILRSIKNRFGGTDEMGVFNMTASGLEDVKNLSKLFLNEHKHPPIGMAIYAGIEGSRPLLMEIQSLIAPSYLPSPRRTAVGMDHHRLAMILAVLEARGGLSFANKDVFVNVAGGIKIGDTSCDLAVAAALISSARKKPLPQNAVFFGEVGLGGEIRRVQYPDMRMKEARKLGFDEVYLGPDKLMDTHGVHTHTVLHISDLMKFFD